MTNPPEERNFGPQPIDTILTEAGLDNHTLVENSGEHLTHKEVAKGRKGRRLSPNLIGKITRALNRALPKDPPWEPSDLFSYAGDVRKSWAQKDGEGEA